MKFNLFPKCPNCGKETIVTFNIEQPGLYPELVDCYGTSAKPGCGKFFVIEAEVEYPIYKTYILAEVPRITKEKK